MGRFSILGKVGEGGIGIVLIGRDDHLERRVAIKMLRESADSTAQERLLREARAAAGVQHPNICQVYEVGEDAGRLYVVMELLEGEPLSARLERGPLPVADGLRLTLDLLAALAEIHRRGFVHRDLKPSNIFLTPHGAKLLDFGIVRKVARQVALADAGGGSAGVDRGRAADLDLTRTGMILGTPRYMAPEQWTGAEAGPTADLFSLGAVLYEAVSGQPAFVGVTVAELGESVLHRQPPALSGGAAAVAADRIVQRALEKRPAQRFASAAEMADAVRAALGLVEREQVGPVRPTTRLLALPLRILRSDPETDFLAYSLPDAIGSSLSGLESLVVRSSLGLGRDAGEAPDLQALAARGEVDVVLTGSLLRSGERLRVATQLVEVSSGTILWSKVSEASLGDLFALEDSLVQEIVLSLAIPLTRGERRRLARDVPASPRAYELYLRANRLTPSPASATSLLRARDLYRECLGEDPGFAPAWARVGRIHRVMAKYAHGDPGENYRLAEEAFTRALELNPDLSVAHNYFTYLQVEEGDALPAMLRLIERGHGHVADPELYAGLVVACRFCGLLEASLAADRRARRLDPQIRTGVHHTWFALGEYERSADADDDEVPACRALAPALLGREAESIAAFHDFERRGFEGLEVLWCGMILAALEKRRRDYLRMYEEFGRSGFHDPEGRSLIAMGLARIGETDEALRQLALVVDRGYWALEVRAPNPWFDGLRQRPEFAATLARAADGRRRAAEEFARAGGARLLGVAP